MKKSNKYGVKLKAEYDDISFIEKALVSDNPLRCIYAITSCVRNNFKSDKVIENLKLLKSSELIEWHTLKVADCASAALDLLGIEKYQGKDDPVTDYIDTVFFTNIED